MGDAGFGDKLHSVLQTKSLVQRFRFVRSIAFFLLVLASFSWMVSSSPAAAQSAGEYFQITYGVATLSQSEVTGDTAFSAAITGKASCIKDLPVSVSEAIISSRIVARNGATGAVVTLNSGYSVTIAPFPNKAGNTVEINQTVPLQFPAGAASGDYDISAELIEAKVKVAFAWAGVTEYLPRAQPIGSVRYTAKPVIPAPLPPPQPVKPAVSQPEPASPPMPAPAKPVAPALSPQPVAQALPESVIPWWVWVIVALALTTTLVNLILMLRNRRVQR